MYPPPPKNDFSPLGVWYSRNALVLALLLAFGPGTVLAAPVTAECPTGTTHTAGNRVVCTESSTTDISIDLDGVDITTEDDDEDGIKAEHGGGTSTTSADITIDVDGTSTDNTISTAGDRSEGIHGKHAGTGDVDIDATGVGITTTGDGASGVYGEHTGTGDVEITIEGTTTGNTISTTGSTLITGFSSDGVQGKHTGTGDVDIDVDGVTITTTEESAIAVRGNHRGTGDNRISVSAGTLKTSGLNAHAIRGTRSMSGSGNTHIEVNEGSSITTEGNQAVGVFGYHSGGTGNIDIDFIESSAVTKGMNSVSAISGQIDSGGSGDIDIEVRGATLTIEGGANNRAIHLDQDSAGMAATNIYNSTILTKAGGTYAINIRRTNSDEHPLHLYMENTRITAMGDTSPGVVAEYSYNADQGTATSHVDLQFRGGSVETQGVLSHGIIAEHRGGGDAKITTFQNFDITTTGTADHPASSLDGTYSYGISGVHRGSGNVIIDMQPGSSVTTKGKNSHGVVAYHFGTEDARRMDITVGGPVTTEGADAQGVRVGTIGSNGPERMAALDDKGYRLQTVTVNSRISSQGPGIYLANGGKVTIGSRGSITSDSGIAILATGTVPAVADDTNTPEDESMAAIPPKLYVDLDLNGRMVSQVIGDDWILNDGGQTTIEVNDVVLHRGDTGVALDENGDPQVVENGAWDIHMLADGVKVTDRSNADPAMWTVSTRVAGVISDRDFSATDFTETRVRCPAGQTGFPNCRGPSPPPEPAPEAMDINEAVMADEDEEAAVMVEGDGAVHIGPQGSLRAASGIAILATGDAPELTVDLDLDGRSVSQVIGDDWIINDGGGTTIIVNGVTLHDAITGVVPGAVAPNGAFNTRVNDEVHIRAEGVRVTDRSDPDPANWVISDRAAGVIADRDFSAADFVTTRTGPDPVPQPPMMIEEYAPRAAVYEALPSVLLGLHERTPTASRSTPVWFRVSGHTGEQDFGSSSVGSEYDLDHVQVEAGKYFVLKGGTEAWATLQYLNGTAEVDSPVQGGDIDVQGLNVSLELCRGCKDGEKYVSGSVSLGRYDLDLDSDTRGKLKQGVGATTYALALEVGRRLQKTAYTLLPRIRLEHASVSIDRFTDAVDARVSYSNADRLAIALGMRAETAPRPEMKDGLSLWGSLDLEHRLDDAKTTARVSGTRLKAESGDSSLLLGLGGTWQRDRLRLNAGLSAREGLDNSAESYGATLDLALQF